MACCRRVNVLPAAGCAVSGKRIVACKTSPCEPRGHACRHIVVQGLSETGGFLRIIKGFANNRPVTCS